MEHGTALDLVIKWQHKAAAKSCRLRALIGNSWRRTLHSSRPIHTRGSVQDPGLRCRQPMRFPNPQDFPLSQNAPWHCFHTHSPKSENSQHISPTPRGFKQKGCFSTGMGGCCAFFCCSVWRGWGNRTMHFQADSAFPTFISAFQKLPKATRIPTYICAHTLGNIHVCSAHTPINKCVSTQRHSHIPRAIFILFQLQLLLRS